MREFDFYIVPTPIGNLQDITFRAIEILSYVDIVACEDTRITQKLLNHYNIKTKCISYHKYNEKERVDFFLRQLNDNKKIALLSDAGTPMICDPGAVIVEELRKHNYTITALPGACAVTTFLSQIPREDDEYTFIGFIPRTSNQIKNILQKYGKQNIVFYDSPERILKTLEIILKICGDVKISLGRELTKLYEEVITDNISDVIAHFNNEIKGEIICILHNQPEIEVPDYDIQIKKLKLKGYSNKDISVVLSTLYDCNKNNIYEKCLELK